MAKEIQLSRGKVAIVDDEDYPSLSIHKWTYHNQGYAYRMIHGGKIPNRTGTAVLMHHAVIGKPKTGHVDHINGNGLDNRRENLRHASPSLNQINSRRSGGVSKNRGIVRSGKKWRARIKLNGKRYNLGSFSTIDEAVSARKAAELKLYGENCPKK